MSEQEKGLMKGANWVRVYHAYFQAMVVEGLSELASRILGVDTGFKIVADIVEKGAMRGFGVLLEEAAKEGVKLTELSMDEVLKYEVACHRYAVEKMGVPFQVFEEARAEKPGEKYYLYTRNCIYHKLAEKNPAVCGVCVGLTTGILRRLGHNARWVRTPERAKQLCHARDRPDWVVYRDPNTKPPECKIVIERLKCE